MEIRVLFLTCVAFISVSGQFLDSEYILNSGPLPIRQRIGRERYEIQPSVSREIEYHNTATAKSPNQGRRHIDNSHSDNIKIGQNNKQTNGFETKPYNIINNGEPLISYDNQYSAHLQQQNQPNYVRESNIQQSNMNIEKQNQYSGNNGNINPTASNSNLKTNPENTHTSQSETNSQTQQSYPSNDNVRTNVNNQQNENIRGNQQPTRTNANNGNTVVTQSQDSYNQQNNPSNERTNQQTDRVYENSRANGTNENLDNKNRKTEPTRRSIDSYSYENRQTVDSTKNNNNRNNEGIMNKQYTEITRPNDNRNYQSTEPSKRITSEDRLVTDGTKSTQDNELASRTHSERRSGTKDDDKWIWSGVEISTKSTVPTVLAVDDRAAFAGDKCPTGQVRFNNMCVNTD